MKKLNLFFIIILLFCTLTGCNYQDPRYINFSMKPNNHYYLDQIKDRILNNEKFTIYVFDTNLYKELEVPNDENNILEDFITSLSEDNYVDETTDTKEPFRLSIIFENNDRFLIKVFNDSIISISPWDGNYKEDIISIKNLPLKLNLFDFCNHIANKPLSK